MVERKEVIGVAELSRRLRRSVESVTGDFWVEGEIASMTHAKSGHVYFTLKDERADATLDVVMYAREAYRARQHLVSGARVQIWGRATIYAPRGRLQLIAQFARPVGRGALLEALEKLKVKLQKEGLFERERKRPLPADVKVIGVVTSSQGAAIHDIVTVAFRRGGVRIILSPARVQGDGAARSIVRAIGRLEKVLDVDVMIIGRGGGSDDDLMAFNDEAVARRLASVRVPVISAVGHKTDTSLTDLVADVRAATPSEAAELCVPDAAQRRQQLRRVTGVLRRAMSIRLVEHRHALGGARMALGDPRFLLAERQQRVDDLTLSLGQAVRRNLSPSRSRVELLHRRLLARHPRAVLASARGRLEPLLPRLAVAQRGRLTAERRELHGLSDRQLAAHVGRLRSLREHLGQTAAALNAMSPLAVLGRGYSIAFSGQRAVRSAGQLAPGDALTVRLAFGSVDTRVEVVHPETDAD